LAKAMLSAAADLGGVNFKLLVIGDLGAGRQGFTPVADALHLIDSLFSKGTTGRIILDQFGHDLPDHTLCNWCYPATLRRFCPQCQRTTKPDECLAGYRVLRAKRLWSQKSVRSTSTAEDCNKRYVNRFPSFFS
jgi:hypothetical protein